MNNNERLIDIDLMRCLRAIINKWKLILRMFCVGILVTSAITLIILKRTDEYAAKASVYSIVDGSYSDKVDSAQVMIGYAEIVKSIKVAERANEILGNIYPDSQIIVDMISIEFKDNTFTHSTEIRIIAQSTNQKEVIAVVNAVAQGFVTEMASIMQKEEVKLLDKATTSIKVYDANKQIATYILGGGFLVAIGVCGILVLKEILAFELATISDGSLHGKLDVIGVIPDYNETS